MKALRIFLLIAGLGAIAAAAAMVLSFDRGSQTVGVSSNGTFVCEPDTSAAAKGKNQSKCTVQHLFINPGKASQEYVETVVFGIVGLGLIGTSIALGQFERSGPRGGRRGAPAQPAYPAGPGQHSGPSQQFVPGAPAGPPPGGPYQ
ncbi:hypothetical protein OG216_38175 [Streptomycetaceae bacterium NBC_01309]